MTTPTPNQSNGRDPRGKFAKGNKGGPGNPYVKQLSAYRAALAKAVTPADIRAAVRALVDAAKGGDVMAIRELLDRTVGKVTQTVENVGESMPVKVIVVREGEEPKG